MYEVETIPEVIFGDSKAGALRFLQSKFQSNRFFTNKASVFTKMYFVLGSKWVPKIAIRKVDDDIIYGQGASFKLAFDVDWELVKEVRNAWGEHADTFTYHRGRWAAIGAKRLMFNEHLVRLERAIRRPLISWPSEVVSRAQEAWLQAMKKYKAKLSIGDHTYTYITEHSTSSVAPGKKWKDLTLTELEEIKDAVTLHLSDRIEAGIGTDKVIKPTGLYYGSRSRAPKPDDIRSLNDEVTVSRTRIVMYKAGMSAANAFLPRDLKVRIYMQALKDVYSKFGKIEVLSPVTMGGKFYTRVAELMKQYTYVATDGANWEINVPSIIPGILAYTTLGVKVLPSGSFDTSLVGSLASLVRIALWLTEGIGNIIAVTVLGDDVGVFVDGKSRIVDIPEISEIDPIDSKLMHCLGWCFLNPETPHPNGIKFTGDDPIGTKGGKVGQTRRVTHVRKLGLQEIRATVGLYKGRLDDGRTFLDVLDRIPKSEEAYPRKIREVIINDG